MGTEAEAREPKSESEDSEASCSSTEGLVVPEGIPSLRGVRYVHGAFPESFLRKLERVREETPVTLASGNMYADRRFLRDEALAKEVLSYLPKHLGFAHVLSDMRFIEYPPGGHILPHTDGVHRDQVTASATRIGSCVTESVMTRGAAFASDAFATSFASLRFA